MLKSNDTTFQEQQDLLLALDMEVHSDKDIIRDPNRAIKLKLGHKISTKKGNKNRNPNAGLVTYLKRQAAHLNLKSNHEIRKNKDNKFAQYNLCNSLKLSKIAIMIKKTIHIKINMDPNGDYQWLKGVGEAFSFLIHSYFLADEESNY